MNVLYVTDYSLDHTAGGSQRTTSFLLEEGRRRGHDVRQFNFDTPITQLFLRNYDVVVSSNLEHILQTDNSSAVFGALVNHPKHVRYERDSCLYLHPQNRQLLFSKARLNVFLSDFHLRFFQEMYGNYFHDTHIVPPYIDPEVFLPDNTKEKTLDTVYCGLIHPLKGCNNLIEFANNHPERQFVVFGWGEESLIESLEKIPNIEFQGSLSHEEIVSVYKRAKYIYHDPIVNEPFCRMVGEAAFCGARFVGNKEKVGAVQEIKAYGLDQIRKNCSKANEDFWDLIESI